MTRRFLPVALALAAAIPLAPARAQIRPGLHFARAADSFDGVNGVHVTLARAVLSPYGTAGFVLRNREVSDTEVSTGGLGLGGGVNLATPGLGAFAEVRFEILDGMGDLFVFRLGLRL